jgi:hypothetical protein
LLHLDVIKKEKNMNKENKIKYVEALGNLDVFKPAGWSAPAKHVRGSIFSSKSNWYSWTGPNYLV